MAARLHTPRAGGSRRLCHRPFVGLLAALLAVAVLAPASPRSAWADDDWTALFDGRALDGWKSTNFGGEGEVRVEDGAIHFDFGVTLTGITHTGEFPTTNYEIRWRAMKVDGTDFFSALTFPYRDTHCSFINGGWGGTVVGISSIDGKDASENETTRHVRFEQGRWYGFRVRVTDESIAVWIDDRQVIDLRPAGRRVGTRNEVDLSKPLGFSAWETRAALRDIAYRRLPADDRPE